MNEDDDDDDDDVGYGDDDGEEDDKNSHSRHTHSSFLNFTQPSALAAHTRPKKHSLKPSQNTLQNPFLPTQKTPSKPPQNTPQNTPKYPQPSYSCSVGHRGHEVSCRTVAQSPWRCCRPGWSSRRGGSLHWLSAVWVKCPFCRCTCL